MADELRQILQRIDGRGYKAYRDIRGAFAFDDLPQGPYVVEARKDGFHPARAVILSGQAAPVGALTLARAQRQSPVEEMASLSVQVVDASGAAVAGAVEGYDS